MPNIPNSIMVAISHREERTEARLAKALETINILKAKNKELRERLKLLKVSEGK